MASSGAAATLDRPRLRLRPIAKADWNAYATICADVELMRCVGNGPVQKPEQAWRSLAMFLGRWTPRGCGRWALERRGSGGLLGRVGLHHPPDWPDNLRSIAVAEAIGERLHGSVELLGNEASVHEALH
jgi:RimJ/RimL family protein N-acetyltransferase